MAYSCVGGERGEVEICVCEILVGECLVFPRCLFEGEAQGDETRKSERKREGVKVHIVKLRQSDGESETETESVCNACRMPIRLMTLHNRVYWSSTGRERGKMGRWAP